MQIYIKVQTQEACLYSILIIRICNASNEKRSLFFSYLSLKNAENSPEKSGESVVKINPVRMALMLRGVLS